MNHLFLAGFLLVQLFLFGCASTNADELIRERRIVESPQWNGERFQNPERVPAVEVGASLKTFWNYFLNKPEGSIPRTPLPVEPFDLTQWDAQQELQFAWFGHATFLIKINNKVILTDPMFSKRAGSFGWLSPKRYAKTPASIDKLPAIDVILITHNHPDHLDEESIKALIPRAGHFIAPLAVGKLLEEWGVSRKIITELDWWEKKTIDGLTITAAPAKHTSERGMLDKNKTLWVSYGIRGRKHNLYLSGDSGWHQGLYKIGKQLGPFGVTFFDIGAYGEQKGWKEVHYTPEEAVKAHRAVRGKLMVPSGWGTFDLALFRWHEPIERFLIAVKQADVNYLTPKIGEVVDPGKSSARETWWRVFIE